MLACSFYQLASRFLLSCWSFGMQKRYLPPRETSQIQSANMQQATCFRKSFLLAPSILLGYLAVCLWAYEVEQKNLICYYDGLGVASRTAAGSLTVENIDASLCTHIIYRYVRFGDDNQVYSTMPNLELDADGLAGTFGKLALMKQLNPSLKTLVSVSEDSGSFSRMAANSDSRASFVSSALDFLESNSLNGLEIVWKYPNDYSGQAADKQNYVSLLRDLRAALSPRGHLIAIAAPVGDRRVRAGFDVQGIATEADLINLMSFDYNGAWDNETGLHAPLYQAAEGEAALSVNWSVNLWLSLGAPAQKLQVGVTAYVRSFNLRDKNQNGLRKPTNGLAKPGPLIKDPKLLGYGEWCELYQKSVKQWRVVRDVAGSRGSYAYSGLLWVSLEDPESATYKGQYIAQMGLGGALVHSLDMDDFGGQCHNGLRFPIAAALKSAMRGSMSQLTSATPVNNRATEGNRNTADPSADGGFIEEGEYPKRPTSGPKPAGPPIRPTTEEPEEQPIYQPSVTRAPAPAPPPPAPVTRPPPPPPPPLRPHSPPPQPSPWPSSLSPSSLPAPDRQQQQDLQKPGAQLPACGTNGNWYFPGPTCRQYYDCTETGAPQLKLCRDKLVWKQSKLWCDFQENVPECVA